MGKCQYKSNDATLQMLDDALINKTIIFIYGTMLQSSLRNFCIKRSMFVYQITLLKHLPKISEKTTHFINSVSQKYPMQCILAVSYTHLTLPTNREV